MKASLIVLMFMPGLCIAEEVRVAVASNFLSPLRALAAVFEAASGHEVSIISGSTGKLYAQIRHGAPFDIFLAADSRRPELLEKEHFAVGKNRFTYAQGQLAFWAPSAKSEDGEACRSLLTGGDIRRLAIANPITAPYGAATESVLQHEKMWKPLQSRIVRGENIGQTLQFIITRNADAGFVALSQIRDPLLERTGCVWEIPDSYHPVLNQQTVLLKRGESKGAAHAFLAFLKSNEATIIIKRMGYALP